MVDADSIRCREARDTLSSRWVSHDPSPRSGPDDWLLRHASRAAVWNALLLPLLAVSNLVLSVVIRRTFGLESGVYDVVLGLSSALVIYSGLGIPNSLPKFLPEIATGGDLRVLRRFLRQAVLIRLGALLLLLVPVNVWATAISNALELGGEGPIYLRWISVLALARSLLDVSIRTLNAFFAQLWSNLFSLFQSVLDLLLVTAGVVLGYRIAGVLGGIVTSAVLVAATSTVATWRRLATLSRQDVGQDPASADPPTTSGQLGRLLRFGLFLYLVALLGVFNDMAFIAPALALVLSTDAVALFATAFKLSFMTMTLVIAAFRGLYQPVFARLRVRGDPAQIQRAFSVITRGQLLILLPAGMGLAVMSGDYIPLLFGEAFRPAVPVAQVLVAAMYGAVILNVPGILLTVDERFRAVLAIQMIPVVAAIVFVLAASAGGLMAAAVVLGGSRLLTALTGYLVCRHTYGLRFPWAFAGRVALASLAMAAGVSALRVVWPTSMFEALGLTVVGMLLFPIGLRLTRTLGPDEVDLLRRSRIPGHVWIVATLAPHETRPSRA